MADLSIRRWLRCRGRVWKSIAGALLLVLLLTPAASAWQLFSDDYEIQLGRDIAVEMEAKHGLYRDPYWNSKIRSMGNEMAAYSARPDLPYQFAILDRDEINAVAIPGGYIYLYRGVLDVVADDHQLAAVIAHEIAHVANRHSMRRLERNLGIQLGVGLLTALLLGDDISGWILRQASNLGLYLADQGFSREDELDADLTGAKLMQAAGYDPRGMIQFFQTLQDVHGREPGRIETFFRTHPPTSQRIAQIEEWLAGDGRQ